MRGEGLERERGSCFVGRRGSCELELELEGLIGLGGAWRG